MDKVDRIISICLLSGVLFIFVFAVPGTAGNVMPGDIPLTKQWSFVPFGENIKDFHPKTNGLYSDLCGEPIPIIEQSSSADPPSHKIGLHLSELLNKKKGCWY
jgi:hypothetical protein